MSSTNLGSIRIFASCVIQHRPLVFTLHSKKPSKVLDTPQEGNRNRILVSTGSFTVSASCYRLLLLISFFACHPRLKTSLLSKQNRRKVVQFEIPPTKSRVPNDRQQKWKWWEFNRVQKHGQLKILKSSFLAFIWKSTHFVLESVDFFFFNFFDQTCFDKNVRMFIYVLLCSFD